MTNCILKCDISRTVKRETKERKKTDDRMKRMISCLDNFVSPFEKKLSKGEISPFIPSF